MPRVRTALRQAPVLGPLLREAKRAVAFGRCAREFRSFAKRAGSNGERRFEMSWSDRWYIPDEATDSLGFEPHYTYHPAWAARILARTRPERHVDIGSTIAFITTVSAFVPIDYYEFRPPRLRLDGLTVGHANLLGLPFADGSIASLSCMHTIEHVGLGRYGDPVDPDGDVRAARELSRVLAPGGDLLFVVPVGRRRIRFNANRVYDYPSAVALFPGLELVQWSLILEDGSGMVDDPEPNVVRSQNEGCGCFWFRKPAR